MVRSSMTRALLGMTGDGYWIDAIGAMTWFREAARPVQRDLTVIGKAIAEAGETRSALLMDAAGLIDEVGACGVARNKTMEFLGGVSGRWRNYQLYERLMDHQLGAGWWGLSFPEVSSLHNRGLARF